jgi:hypothetical protein
VLQDRTACGGVLPESAPAAFCWTAITPTADAGCAVEGAWQRFDPSFGLWVQVVECRMPEGFRFFLAVDEDVLAFYPATDGGVITRRRAT